MPPALDDEFSSNGDCATATGRKAFFTTIYGRVFRSSDFGRTWAVSEADIGAWGIDFRTNRMGLWSGPGGLARTRDGGVTWEVINDSIRGDVAWWFDHRGDERATVPDDQKIVFGGGGSQVSRDRGKTWEWLDDRIFDRIDCVEASPVCWATIQSGGDVAKLVVE